VTATEPGSAERIGPGALVLVVGPSGAGKDTLIALARKSCAHDPAIVFPRRIVTRPGSETEDHQSVAQAAFEAASGQGAFAFWWEAHGLHYALPVGIDADIRAGRTVVCNVSRAIVQSLRERYAGVIVVLVTAPREVLEARLAGRARPSDGDAAARLDRIAPGRDDLRPDVVIENVRDPQAGARVLFDVIGKPARRQM
jgi:ribose 1,5-bisphosphokinase